MRGYKFMGAILVIATFFTMAGGAGAAKINDRQVKSRHFATSSVHCRALDKYLKGHLCGPNATIKKVQAGPPGPPGPAGTTEIFYVQSDPTASPTTVFNVGGVSLEANCGSNPSEKTLVLSANKSNGTLRGYAVKGNNAVDFINIENVVAGTQYQPFATGGNTAQVVTMTYVHSDGTVLTGTFQSSWGDDVALNDTRDCVFAGHLNT